MISLSWGILVKIWDIHKVAVSIKIKFTEIFVWIIPPPPPPVKDFNEIHRLVQETEHADRDNLYVTADFMKCRDVKPMRNDEARTIADSQCPMEKVQSLFLTYLEQWQIMVCVTIVCDTTGNVFLRNLNRSPVDTNKSAEFTSLTQILNIFAFKLSELLSRPDTQHTSKPKRMHIQFNWILYC
jgi:hypothetical protein